jgi:protein involved in polysaccharide export with SLBB domain
MKMLCMALGVFVCLGGLRAGQAGDIANANQPVQRIGADDLISVAVYDSPELTRTVRVGDDGQVRLPMLRRAIPAAG